MTRIYTRTGDNGTTAIHGHRRVAKTDIRIEANGTLDELNVAIGVVRAHLTTDDPRQDILHAIQINIMTSMSLVATPDDIRHKNPNSLPENMVEDVEKTIDEIAARCSSPTHFILPGGTPLSAFLHSARVTCRRAERRLWELNESDAVPPLILKYINRISDLFFFMAKEASEESGREEDRWKSFAYKREKK